MKKVFQYLRSMRFGILLLILIAVCSVVGTVIPQGREIAFYAQTYRAFHGVILLLKLHNIFESWYFVLLLVLLCLNLSLCSLLRIRTVVRAAKTETERAARMPDTLRLSPAGVQVLRQHMEAMRCRKEEIGDTAVYRKHAFGRYGSFLTHLAILLTLVFGALALYTPTVTDKSVMPGESVFMADGTEIHVQDFRITDETGRLDYRSHVQVTLPDGRRSELAELKVNHPFSFGPWKLFQQSFGTAGSVTVTNLETGGSDDFLMDSMSYLTIDERNGIVFEQLYPDYLRAPSGEVTLITVTEGAYQNPIYAFQVLSDGVYTPSLAVPGDSLEVLGYRFTFNRPVEYPGLRIKHVSTAVNALLVAAFTLMILGLYITFFYEPVLVKADEKGCAVGGPKPERMRLELEDLLAAYIQAPENKEESKT